MGASVDKVFEIKYRAKGFLTDMWFINVTTESLLLNPSHRGCFDSLLRDGLWKSEEMDQAINFLLYEIECANNIEK